MSDTLETLKAALAKAQVKAERFRVQYEAAAQEVAETETAIKVIERLSGLPLSIAGVGVGSGDVGAAILAHVVAGRENGRAPKDIYDALMSEGRADLNADQIRTQLWRMAKRGVLHSENGRYWREPPPTARAPAFGGYRQQPEPVALDDTDEIFGEAPQTSQSVDFGDDDF